MRKRLSLLLLGVLAASSTVMISAKERTFTTACYNVDGLPAKILVTINADGPQAEGTEKISQRIAEKGWDFFGVSEDFEFHSNLVSHLGDYGVGTYRGTVTAKNTSAANMADTDGLEFLWKNEITVTDETMVPWVKKFGGLTKGADECIDKGFRYYCVHFPDGFEVDVYVHHMNSGDEAGHLDARAVQLQQLADYIIASDNKRPIIIMGDTNCRWTRDPLVDFFGKINADPRFTINDPWVDFMWKGWYPSYGGSLMVGDLGNQKGEVVDKIFYINNTDASGVHLSANGYLQDDSFLREDGTTPLADHHPIVIEFKIEDNYQAPDPGEVVEDELANKEYYIRNVSTGKYFKAGGAWGTHSCQSGIGGRVVVLKGDAEGEYALRSTLGFINDPSNFSYGADFYMDAAAPRYFKFIPVEGTDAYYITWKDADGNEKAIAAVDGDALASVNGRDFEDGNAAQQWVFVPESELVAGLASATGANPLDATFLVRGYDLCVNDGDNKAWEFVGGSSVKQETWGPNEWNTKTWVYRVYNGRIYGSDKTKGAWTVSQTVKGLPNGNYEVSCQMLTDYAPADGDGAFVYSLNGVPVEGIKDIAKNGKVTSEEAVNAFATGEYNLTAKAKVTNGELEIKMEMGDHNVAAAACFDNFALKYFGPDGDVITGVEDIVAADIVSAEAYTVGGVLVGKAASAEEAVAGLGKGIYIIRLVLADGSVSNQKYLR